MSVPEVVDRYFAAWNAHDAAAIVATFAPDGTYENSATGRPVRGDAIGENAAALWSTLPDVQFEIVSQDVMATGVAVQWIMRGTNRGSLGAFPQTGRSVAMHGADFIRVGPDGIESVRGYFDSADMPRQLGLQVVVQPVAAGPFTFGTSVRVGAPSTATPGAFSITLLRARDGGEVEHVRSLSRRIAAELSQRPGFLGWIGATIGNRVATVTAWEHPDHPRQAIEEGTHQDAMSRFFKDVGECGWTSVWTPERISAFWIRCQTCGQMADPATTSTCPCGASLPDPEPYW